MQFSIPDTFYFNLFILNFSLVFIFVIVYYCHEKVLEEIGNTRIRFGSLSSKNRKIVYKYFRYYRKLAPQLRRRFEEKLEYFYHAKEYRTAEGKEPHKKVKLLIAAYAAQISMGMPAYKFQKLKKIIIHQDKFTSPGGRQVSWHLNDEGALLLSWKDFFYELRNPKILAPIGLKIMAYAMKIEAANPLKEEVYKLKSRSIYKNSAHMESNTNSVIYSDATVKDRDNFFMFCLLNYFSNPQHLKNSYPEVFKRLEFILFKEIA